MKTKDTTFATLFSVLLCTIPANATLPITNKMPPSDSPSIVIGQNKHTNKLDLSTKKLGTYQLTASPVDGHKIQITPANPDRVKLAFHDFTNPSRLRIIEVEVFRASK